MRPYPLTLSIPKPCHERWDEMTPTEHGRHCAQCNKTVIDFTNWSDAQLYGFFAAKKTEVCGRLLSTQLKRSISIPHQPHSMLYRLTIALGLTLICSSAAMAQNKPPMVRQNIVTADTPGSSVVKDSSRRPTTSELSEAKTDSPATSPIATVRVQSTPYSITTGGAVVTMPEQLTHAYISIPVNVKKHKKHKHAYSGTKKSPQP